MARPKGSPKPAGSGRAKGTPNKVTANFKEAFSYAFQGLGGGPHLLEWARENPTEFYRLLSKMLPREIEATLHGGVKLMVVEELVDSPENGGGA